MLKAEPVVQTDVGRALKRLLPRMEPADYESLNRQARETLNRLLSGSDRELVAAVIEALKAVGDASAIEGVRQLAEGRLVAQVDASLQQAAAECLAILEERAKRETQQAVLLRPAAGASEEALLRPAEGRPGGDEELLLRVSEGPQLSSVTRPE